jgi:aminoglycoside phosphotransferase (APT) family kinase protein
LSANGFQPLLTPRASFTAAVCRIRLGNILFRVLKLPARKAIFEQMIELGPDNVIDYLHSTGRLEPNIPATARRLAGGVSNVVLRIEPAAGDDFIIKQSRGQLRTKAAWFSRLDRVYREMDVMAVLASVLPLGVVPRILFEDRQNYLFGMQAVRADHVVWKAELLAGRTESWIAEATAGYLSTIHRRSFEDVALREKFVDHEVFDQLRIDPFYRRIAEVHPQIESAVNRWIDEMLATPVCLVLADFSPKNMLVVRDNAEGEGRLTLVDFETAHCGDPAFDLGFFFSHLLLKTVLHADRAGQFFELARAFRQRYFDGLGKSLSGGVMSQPALERRTVRHLAACMLARIDGKSTIDYLPDPADQHLVRTFCLDLFSDPPKQIETVFQQLDGCLGQSRR